MPPKKAVDKKVSGKGRSNTLPKKAIAKKPAGSAGTQAPQFHVKLVDALHLQGVLHEAIIYGHGKKALAALSDGASPTVASNGWTPLHTCAMNGRDVILRHLLDKYSAQLDLNARHPNTGDTPLHRAAWGGRHDDKTDKRGQGKLECARMLIDAGALINAVSENGETPLDEAAKWGETQAFVQMLTKAGADLRART